MMKLSNLMRILSLWGGLTCLAIAGNAVAGPGPTVVDLTHTLPTFEADAGDPLLADITKPFPDATATGGDSVPIATFFGQAVMTLPPPGGVFGPIEKGNFLFNQLILWEHHGTHIDSPSHFTLDDPQPGDDMRTMESLTATDLIGKVVYIDISDRVQAEIDRAVADCGDVSCADFDEFHGVNNVQAFDIRAVEHQIKDGVWIVINLGWAQFYGASGPRAGDPPDPVFGELVGPYINEFNFPGFTTEAVDELIAIEDEKEVRINGIAADNVGIDTGSLVAANDWPSHYKGFPRGWKLLENVANTGALAFKSKQWMLVTGTPKHASGTGGPARVFAIRQPIFGKGVIEGE